MAEAIDESVSVDLLSNHISAKAYPWVIHWRGRQHRITTVGLHQKIRDGRSLYHFYSVSDGTMFFHLRLDTETLLWKLLEVESH